MISNLRYLVNNAYDAYDKKGLWYVLRNGPPYVLREFFARLEMEYYRSRSANTFSFRNDEYEYFYHMYNNTWKNPRTVEIPIAWELTKKFPDDEILEVGNVLSHYYSTSHTIIDKYEDGSGARNVDIVDYKTDKKYSLVLCISTLEHIGFNYGEQEDPKKIRSAVETMKSLLSDDGRLFVTIPYDYNPHLDRLLEDGALGFSETHHLHRVSKWNEWRECDWDTVTTTTFGDPFPYANGLTIAYYSP